MGEAYCPRESGVRPLDLTLFLRISLSTERDPFFRRIWVDAQATQLIDHLLFILG
jgi:hypothetical protein